MRGSRARCSRRRNRTQSSIQAPRGENPMTREERLNAIWARTVEKLKEVVHEFKITEDELHAAGDYINRLGQSGMGRSLVDVSLALTSVAANTPGRRGTRSNLEGPYHAKHPIRA